MAEEQKEHGITPKVPLGDSGDKSQFSPGLQHYMQSFELAVNAVAGIPEAPKVKAGSIAALAAEVDESPEKAAAMGSNAQRKRDSRCKLASMGTFLKVARLRLFARL